MLLLYSGLEIAMYLYNASFKHVSGNVHGKNQFLSSIWKFINYMILRSIWEQQITTLNTSA